MATVIGLETGSRLCESGRDRTANPDGSPTTGAGSESNDPSAVAGSDAAFSVGAVAVVATSSGTGGGPGGAAGSGSGATTAGGGAGAGFGGTGAGFGGD